MKKTWKRGFMAMFVTVFVSSAGLAPVMTQVFAAEQTIDQDQQNPPSDVQQGDHDEHMGHHG